ncbi:hypothetical protein [Micromonospora pisi]|uniref:hypothetical protein n=1 Tax=Micromonospora pisi TaxID=589240 RepID=UPI001B87BD4E|nr:hypothetical protein [Micromonospora pisi]
MPGLPVFCWTVASISVMDAGGVGDGELDCPDDGGGVDEEGQAFEPVDAGGAEGR